MSEVCSDKVTSTQIFSHGSDSTDSDDFIQSHIDSFFPPVDSGEVIDEYREGRSDYRIDYVVDLVDDAVDMLVAGFAYVRDLVQTVGEMIVEWGMQVIDAIGKAFSAVRDAVSEVGELMSALAQWIKEKVSSMFSSVVDPIVEELQDWAEGIQEAMENFFDELAKWDNDDGDVDATMEAGTSLMLSFISQQDRAQGVMDVLKRIMRFIEPFQEYLSPFGAIGVITEWIGAESSNFGNVLEEAKNLFEDGVTKTTEAILGFFDGIMDTEVDLDMELPTMEGLKNFNDATGMSNSLIEGIMDGYENYFGSENLSSVDSNSMDVIQILGMGLTALSFAQALGLGWSDGMAQALYAGNLALSLISQIAVAFSEWSVGTQVGVMTLTSIPLLSLGLIFFGMKITGYGINPYELGIVGGTTLIGLITYVGTIKKAAPGV